MDLDPLVKSVPFTNIDAGLTDSGNSTNRPIGLTDAGNTTNRPVLLTL